MTHPYMQRLNRPGWPGNLLAVVAGAITTLALAPFDIWPLALVAVGLFYIGLRERHPARPWAAAGVSVSACLAPAPAGSTTAFTTSAALRCCWRGS